LSFFVVGSIATTLLIGATAVSGEDDVVDSIAFGVFVLVCLTVGAALTSLSSLLAYLSSPVGAGAPWRKVVFDDVVNFALYVLRVFLC